MNQFLPDRRAWRHAGLTTLVAVALVAVAAFTVAESTDSAIDLLGSWVPVILVLILQGVVLLWLDKAPLRVLVVVAVLPLSIAFLDLRAISTVTTAPIILATYVAATRRAGHPLRVAVAAAALGVLVTEFAAWRAMPLHSALLASAALCVVVLGAPLAVAFVVVTRRRMVDALRAEKNALERVQGALLDAAIARERAGIARELHDIAAHHMSGIALMCAAVERQVDTDHDAAKAGLRQIREQSRLVLADLREAVGLLRGDTEDGVETRRIEAVHELADSHSAAGRPVTFQVSASAEGELLGEGLGPLAHLAGYRMVQESLANAARHAPSAPTEVLIDDSAPSALTITVTNGPAPYPVAQEEPGGFGLRGMLERAQLVRGTLQYGATPEGGWRVSLQLPRLQSAATGEAL